MAKTPHILVVNSGSSSLKLSLFGSDAKSRILDARFSGINDVKAVLEVSSDDVNVRTEHQGPISLQDALSISIEMISTQQGVQIQPRAVGHRIVHGGEQFTDSVVVDKGVMASLTSLSHLAPLHNPQGLEGIKASTNLFGDNVEQVAVFDTSFHRSMPPHASHYGIDLDMAKRYGIQRYGFHGISHHYLWDSYLKHSIRAKEDSKVITLHLGNGCSACAIHGGKSMDTSMGFTPAEGLLMGTRAGDIDAAVVDYLCEQEKVSSAGVMEMLNSRAGLLGLSGVSSNMAELLKIQTSNKRAALAIDMFCYRIVKYIGAYIAALQGADAIIFAGGIGENSSALRQRILAPLAWCGAAIDDDLNHAAVGLFPGDLRRISQADAFTEVYVIGTDENAFIAMETKKKMADVL